MSPPATSEEVVFSEEDESSEDDEIEGSPDTERDTEATEEMPTLEACVHPSSITAPSDRPADSSEAIGRPANCFRAGMILTFQTLELVDKVIPGMGTMEEKVLLLATHAEEAARNLGKNGRCMASSLFGRKEGTQAHALTDSLSPAPKKIHCTFCKKDFIFYLRHLASKSHLRISFRHKFGGTIDELLDCFGIRFENEKEIVIDRALQKFRSHLPLNSDFYNEFIAFALDSDKMQLDLAILDRFKRYYVDKSRCSTTNSRHLATLASSQTTQHSVDGLQFSQLEPAGPPRDPRACEVVAHALSPGQLSPLSSTPTAEVMESDGPDLPNILHLATSTEELVVQFKYYKDQHDQWKGKSQNSTRSSSYEKWSQMVEKRLDLIAKKVPAWLLNDLTACPSNIVLRGTEDRYFGIHTALIFQMTAIEQLPSYIDAVIRSHGAVFEELAVVTLDHFGEDEIICAGFVRMDTETATRADNTTFRMAANELDGPSVSVDTRKVSDRTFVHGEMIVVRGCNPTGRVLEVNDVLAPESRPALIVRESEVPHLELIATASEVFMEIKMDYGNPAHNALMNEVHGRLKERTRDITAHLNIWEDIVRRYMSPQQQMGCTGEAESSGSGGCDHA